MKMLVLSKTKALNREDAEVAEDNETERNPASHGRFLVSFFSLFAGVCG
jgi:hypothetical protein